MELILKLIIGGIGGAFFIYLFIKAYDEYKENADVQKKIAARKTDNENKIPNVFPYLEYDSSGHRIATELETLSENDSIDIQKIENSTSHQKELDLQRKKRRKRTGRRPYN